MTNAAQQLAPYGISTALAQYFFFANLSSPATIYTVCQSIGLTNAMVSEIFNTTGVTAGVVKTYFQSHGLDANALDTVPGASAQFNPVVTVLTAGDDIRDGTTAADNLDGDAGSDALDGLAGNDVLDGRVGNDTLKGGRGFDKLNGGDGDDQLYAGSFVTVESYSYYDSGSHSYVSGSNYTFDDVFAELLYGGAGNDRLYGGYGSDYLEGGAGDDRLEGDYNTTDEAQASASQRQSMLNDTLYGGAGADTLIGGNGNDVYVFKSLGGVSEVATGETITDTGGVDTLRVQNSTDFSLLNDGTVSLGSMGIERVLITSAETATFTAAQMAGSAVAFNATAAGYGAHVVVEGVRAGGGNDFSLLAFMAFDGNDAFDASVDSITFHLNNQLSGSFTGTAMADAIQGVIRDTTVAAGGGNDTISIDYGLGHLPGTIDGGSGTDTLLVWSGNLSGQNLSSIVLGASALASVTSVERIEFACAGSASLVLDSTSNSAFANGIEVVVQSASSLSVMALLSSVAITATGTANNDYFWGGSAVDTFTGGAGSDSFVLTMAERDTAAGAVTDIITDFSSAQGDRITLGMAGTTGNFAKGGSFASLASLLTVADAALGGALKIVAGMVGGDTYLVADGNGTGYTQVVKLVGVNVNDINYSDVSA